MAAPTERTREGSLEAPTRHPLDWKNPEFYEEGSLFTELERVFDICHGCRRCFSLCNSFPTLFDAIDESPSQELDGVDKEVFWKVVDHCYLCDLCYMTKCPYVPPHPWNVDFPHLMLRAKAVKFKKGEVRARDKLLSSTETVARLAGIPVVSRVVNTANQNGLVRKALDKVLGVHPNALLPEYHSRTLRKRLAARPKTEQAVHTEGSLPGKVVLFVTCYANYNEPALGEDLVVVFEHNGIPVAMTEREKCCGMPKLEIGDLATVEQFKQFNIAELVRWVDQGYAIVAPVPSCVLMFRQEIPLMFPGDEQVMAVRGAIFDPFEYLLLRHREGLLKTDFKQSLGKIAYHAACHQRVQNIGPKTRELLQLIPETRVETIERCSGHDGTYAVRSESHEVSMKIGRPVFNQVSRIKPDYYTSDCPMAGHQIENGLRDGSSPVHPISLVRKAYGI